MLRLANLASQNWMSFEGWATSRNVDLDELNPRSYLSLIYYWATKNGEPDQVSKFDAKLWQPPKGKAATSGPWAPENEKKAFASFQSSVGSGGVKTPKS